MIKLIGATSSWSHKHLFANDKTISENALLNVCYKDNLTGNEFLLGKHPFSEDKYLTDISASNILLVGDNKSLIESSVLPNYLNWKDNLFVLDQDDYLWGKLMQQYMKNSSGKVIRFKPFGNDSLKWNPLNEIAYGTKYEFEDTFKIASILVKGLTESPELEYKASVLLAGIILHLHYLTKYTVHTLADVSDYLNKHYLEPERIFTEMINSHHINSYEFMEEEFMDYEGPSNYENPFRDIYGEYVKDFSKFTEYFRKKGIIDINDSINSINDIKVKIVAALEQNKKWVLWDTRTALPKLPFEDEEPIPAELQGLPPFHLLLTHPKVAEAVFAVISDFDNVDYVWLDIEKRKYFNSVLSIVRAAVSVYNHPCVKENTASSDFSIRKLLSDTNAVFFYEFSSEIHRDETPLFRLLIDMLCLKILEKKVPDTSPNKMLFLFNAYSLNLKFDYLERVLQYSDLGCTKICFYVKNLNEFSSRFGTDNYIADCNIHVFYTPSMEKDLFTANHIALSLGLSSDSLKDIIQMPFNHELIFSKGYKTILAEKIEFPIIFPSNNLIFSKVNANENKEERDNELLQFFDIYNNKQNNESATVNAEKIEAKFDDNTKQAINNVAKTKINSSVTLSELLLIYHSSLSKNPDVKKCKELLKNLYSNKKKPLYPYQKEVSKQINLKTLLEVKMHYLLFNNIKATAKFFDLSVTTIYKYCALHADFYNWGIKSKEMYKELATCITHADTLLKILDK